MKTHMVYMTDEHKTMEMVPAEVAQQLYDIVEKLVEHGAWYPSAIELDTFEGPQGEDLEHEAKTALAAADGEDV